VMSKSTPTGIIGSVWTLDNSICWIWCRCWWRTRRMSSNTRWVCPYDPHVSWSGKWSHGGCFGGQFATSIARMIVDMPRAPGRVQLGFDLSISASRDQGLIRRGPWPVAPSSCQWGGYRNGLACSEGTKQILEERRSPCLRTSRRYPHTFMILLKSNKVTQTWEISPFQYLVSKVRDRSGIMLMSFRYRDTQSASSALPLYRTFNDADSFTKIGDGAAHVCSSYVQVRFINNFLLTGLFNSMTVLICSRTRPWLFSFTNCIFFLQFPFWSDNSCQW
jgi:hypothetical protein